MIEYQVVRSRRKTLSLQVKHGQVLVRAPYCVDDKYITTLIDHKSAWLKAKIFQQSQANEFCCDFSQGSMLFLFGKLVTLEIIFAKLAGVVLTDDNINSQQVLTIALAQRNKNKLNNRVLLAAAVKKQIEHYFKQQAQQMLPLKVATYAQLTSLTPTSIKIRQYRARWGSCNNRGELSFNYLLMMLPIEVINYVVIHELCHLQYLNHSQKFWQLVAKHCPQYTQVKQWMKINQSALHWRLPSH